MVDWQLIALNAQRARDEAIQQRDRAEAERDALRLSVAGFDAAREMRNVQDNKIDKLRSALRIARSSIHSLDIGDLAKLRSEEEITHGHVMGRIAIALFSERNNRTDEECVAKVAEVVYERDNLRKHLHDEHQRHIGTMNECDVLRQDCFNLTEKVIPNLREQRDALRALLREAKKFVPAPLGNAILAALAGDKP